MSKEGNIKEFIYTMRHNDGYRKISIVIIHRQQSSLQLVAVAFVRPNFITYDIFLPLRRVL